MKDLDIDANWKDQIEDWAFAMLKDGICSGAARNYRIDKCVADRFIIIIYYDFDQRKS